MDQAAELLSLLRICSKAELWDEGGQPLVYLPDLKVQSDGATHVVNALLSPRAREGYSTRLFLSKAFPGKGQNWKTYSIKGSTWHACSWNGVPESLSWLEILACHLGPLK